MRSIPGLTLYGQNFNTGQRAPTIAFTLSGLTPATICKRLGEKGICAWDGHFYAIRAAEILNVLEKGGVVRMGAVVYNTEEEIDDTIDQVSQLH